MALRKIFCLRSSLSLSDAILARGRNSLSNQATASIPLGLLSVARVGIPSMALRKFFCLRSSLSLSDAILARGRNSLSNQATASIPLGLLSVARVGIPSMALRNFFCLRSSLSLSDAILARGRNSLSNQATASIPLGSGNMVSSYGPPASVHSASEITQPLVSQLSNLSQNWNKHLQGRMFSTRMFSTTFDNIDVESLQAEVDWRRSGAMSSIDYQGHCGSCWAHSTVSAVEVIKKLKTGLLEKLSSQELIDCVDGCEGCKTGWPELAFEYIRRRGLSLESDYPNSNLNIQGECIVKSTNVKTFIAGYQRIQYMEDGAAENRLKHVVTFQPVVVVLLVGKEFRGYKAGDGIFQTEVDPQDLSIGFHAVLVIRFGERNGNKYWLIRNSYGVQWGYEGYALIERDCGNLHGRCAIARFPVYPIWEAGVSPSLPEAAQILRDVDLSPGQPLQTNHE